MGTMDQIVVAWPHIVVVGILWFVALSAIIGFQLWRIEVNTRVLQNVQALIDGKNQPLPEQPSEHVVVPLLAIVDAVSTPQPAASRRQRPDPQYAHADIEKALEQVRQTSGKHTLVTSNWHNGTEEPIITVEHVDDDDLEEETIVNGAAMVNFSGMWKGDDDDDFEEDRKTVEMWAPKSLSLEVLRHLEEGQTQHARGSSWT